MGSSLSAAILQPSSVSPSSSTQSNVIARLITPLNMHFCGVVLLIMEPVHKSAFEVSSTPKSFLEMFLALTLLYRGWQSPLPQSDLNIPVPHIYFDNLQIEEPSPYDNDHDYAKIQTPYLALHF
jgi:hypothetical protein